LQVAQGAVVAHSQKTGGKRTAVGVTLSNFEKNISNERGQKGREACGTINRAKNDEGQKKKTTRVRGVDC